METKWRVVGDKEPVQGFIVSAYRTQEHTGFGGCKGGPKYRRTYEEALALGEHDRKHWEWPTMVRVLVTPDGRQREIMYRALPADQLLSQEDLALDLEAL